MSRTAEFAQGLVNLSTDDGTWRPHDICSSYLKHVNVYLCTGWLHGGLRCQLRSPSLILILIPIARPAFQEAAREPAAMAMKEAGDVHGPGWRPWYGNRWVCRGWGLLCCTSLEVLVWVSPMGMCCLAAFAGISLPHVIALLCYLTRWPPNNDSPVMHARNCNEPATNQMANSFPDVHAWLSGTRTLFQGVSESCKGAHSSPTNAQTHTCTDPGWADCLLSSRLGSCNRCLIIIPQALMCDDLGDLALSQAILGALCS